MLRVPFLIFLLTTLLSCNANPNADETRGVRLLTDGVSARDSLELHLSRQLRTLLEAITASDSVAIAALITGGFTAMDARIPPKRRALGYVPEELTYWQVIAGKLSQSLDAEYSTFSAEPRGNVARVHAAGITHIVWTTWSYRSAVWRADRLLITPLDPKRRAISADPPSLRPR
jgi:hypothetical protein